MSQDQSGDGWNDAAAMKAACAAAGATLAGVRIMQDKAARASALASRHKPAFWWAIDREPWKRIAAEIDGHAHADAAPATK